MYIYDSRFTTITARFRALGARRHELAALLWDAEVDRDSRAVNQARRHLAVLEQLVRRPIDIAAIWRDPAPWLDAVGPKLAAQLLEPAELDALTALARVRRDGPTPIAA